MSLSFRRPSFGAALVALSLLLSVLLLPLAPARADAGRWLNSPGYGELSAAIAALRPGTSGAPVSLTAEQQQRYDDLLALQAAIVRSDDRSQVNNRTSHQLGVFARSKKAPAGTPAEFLVLGAGHETDDDFEVIGLYLPAGVALRWGDGSGVPAAPEARLARLLEGQVLRVAEPVAVAADAATTEAPAYALDLPAFAVLSTSEQVAAIPALSQADLDAHPETAPVD